MLILQYETKCGKEEQQDLLGLESRHINGFELGLKNGQERQWKNKGRKCLNPKFELLYKGSSERGKKQTVNLSNSFATPIIRSDGSYEVFSTLYVRVKNLAIIPYVRHKAIQKRQIY